MNNDEESSALALQHFSLEQHQLAQQQLQMSQQDGLPQPVAVGAFASASPSGYLRLRGLPFSAGESDIRAFFGEFEVQQVFICKRNGRSNGEAFIQLVDAAQTANALAHLNRQHMGPRYIELFEALEGDMATAKALTVDRLRGYVIRMRGLPYNASPGDVLRFLSGVEVVRGMEGIIFTWTPDGRPTGEAFVELKDEDAQREAMKKHKEKMGTRYIEIFTSTKSALVQAIQHNRLILGFANRKRWLQQAGLPGSAVLLPGAGGQTLQVTHLMGPGGSMDQITEGFAGMSMRTSGMGGSIQLHPSMQAPGSGGLMLQQAMGGGGGGGLGSLGGLAGGSGGLVLQQGGPMSTGNIALSSNGAALLNAIGRDGMGAQVTYQTTPSGYIQAQVQPRQSLAGQSGQLLQVSQPNSNASLPPSSGYTTVQLGGGQSALMVHQHQPHQYQLVGQGQQGGMQGGMQQQQYVTVDSAGSVGTAYAGLQGSAEQLGRVQGAGQYVVAQQGGAPGGGYTLQAIQLHPNANIHEYLKLSHQQQPGGGGGGGMYSHQQPGGGGGGGGVSSGTMPVSSGQLSHEMSGGSAQTSNLTAAYHMQAANLRQAFGNVHQDGGNMHVLQQQ